MAEAASKSAVEKIAVQMTDGRTVHFGKKQKLVKNSTIEGNSVSVQLDFVNGETRTFAIPDALLARFAAHGAEQKLGDAIAGENEIDDAVLSVDELIGRLNNGEWTATRQAGAMAGTSVLIRALVEVSGKSVEEVKAYLADKSQAEKLALRRSDRIKPVVERLEAEKATKSNSVDTGALLAGLGLGDEPAPKGKREKADA